MKSNSHTRINIVKSMFNEKPLILIKNESFEITTFVYESGVAGLKIDNGHCNMVVLPYMGHQIWFAEFEGKKLNQKSIFDYPKDTTKFGDNYGAFLIHCGLTNINGPDEGESYPMHGELPFAKYHDNYIEIGNDSKGNYISCGGVFDYRNSQDYYYEYIPELKIYENESIANMNVQINNKRKSDLNYLYMCHMNWLAVDGSILEYSAVKNNVKIQDLPKVGSSKRENELLEFVEKIESNPFALDKIDLNNQNFNPELCINIKYEKDDNNWSHATQVFPDGNSAYVGFNSSNLPYGLRWYCQTGDENGLGFALPTTGTNRSSKYQYENGNFNTIKGNESDFIQFKFGYLNKEETQEMSKHIKKIIEGK